MKWITMNTRLIGLQMAYDRARNQHMRNAEEWGMI